MFHFTDADPAGSVNDYTATVNTGDATLTSTINPTAVQIVANPAGGFDVRLSYTYVEELTNQTFGVTVADAGGSTTGASMTFNVADPAVVPTGGFTVTAVEGNDSGMQTVATFTDPGGPEAVNDYAASINWGDGTAATAGVISYSNGTLTVQGRHTYAEESAADHPGSNPYTITVTISHEQAPTSTTISRAVVSDPAVVPTGGFTLYGLEGQNSGIQPVATFTDPGGPEPIGDYTATIAWGDSYTSTGTIQANANGSFRVSANHTFAEEGTYTITITLAHEMAPLATTTSTVVVIDNTGLLLLDPSAKGALTVGGQASLAVTNGGVINVASGNAAGVLAGGNARVTATEFDLHGSPGYQTSGQASLKGEIDSAVPLSETSMAVPADLAALPAPSASGSANNANYAGQTAVTLQPGTYSNLQVSGQAVVTLAPGTYYLKGGLSVSGQAVLTGQDVVLYFPSGSSLNLSGNAKVTLTPPAKGTYQGVVLFADRATAVPLAVTGNANLLFSGTVYAAASTLTVGGNGVFQGFNAEVVAADLNESGNAVVQIQANAFNRVLPLGDIVVVATGSAGSSSGAFSTDSTGSNTKAPTVTDLALLNLMARWAGNAALAVEDDLLDSLVVQLAAAKKATAPGGSGPIDVYFSGSW